MINNNLQRVICRHSLHNKKRKFDDAIVMNCLNCSLFFPSVRKLKSCSGPVVWFHERIHELIFGGAFFLFISSGASKMFLNL